MKVIFRIIFIGILLSSIFFSQKVLFAHQRSLDAQIVEQPLFIPSSEFLKTISFGYDLLISDILWLDAIQYVGGDALNYNQDTLYQYLQTITDVDPHFEYAYKAGQLLLPQKYDDHHAVSLSLSGMIHNPSSWELPFYLGFIYSYVLKNNEKASLYYQYASMKEGAPAIAQTLAASSISRFNQHEYARKIWISLLETTENDLVKQLAEINIIRETNFIFLNIAQQKYFELFGENILSVYDLIIHEIIPALPQDPQGFEYTWNTSTQSFELQ